MAKNAALGQAPERQGRMKWQQVDIEPVTIEDADQAIADGINAAIEDAPSYAFAVDTEDIAIASLERQLANDEPKCANCLWWGANGGTIRPCCLPAKPPGLGITPITTDLSVCSAWAGK
jgi:hypothetical protein